MPWSVWASHLLTAKREFRFPAGLASIRIVQTALVNAVSRSVLWATGVVALVVAGAVAALAIDLLQVLALLPALAHRQWPRRARTSRGILLTLGRAVP